jgi:endonuclease III related protein
MATTDKLKEIFQLLVERFGPQYWWPGQSRFEIIVGAILTQNTSWSNVEKAIENLKSKNLLTPQKLYDIDVNSLAELIRPAGYYNIKAARLKNFLVWLFDNYNGELEKLESLSTSTLREDLLAIKGIGPETADSILLYALNKPSFVVDAYTARITVRHKLIEPNIEYDQLKELFESNLPCDVKLFNEFHALLVQVGKNFCKPRPNCQACPLQKLPHEVNPEYF